MSFDNQNIKMSHPYAGRDVDSCLRSNVFLGSFFAFVFMMIFTGLAQAQEKSPICQILAVHKPADDVAYQPGIDVEGNAVVPADINSPAFNVPDVIKVPLDIQLAERLSSDVEGLDLQAPVGVVEIYQDGRVLYNGQDWAQPMAVACDMMPESTDDGQQAEDVIKSETVNEPQVWPAMDVQHGGIEKEVNIGQIEVDPLVEETQE